MLSCQKLLMHRVSRQDQVFRWLAQKDEGLGEKRVKKASKNVVIGTAQYLVRRDEFLILGNFKKKQKTESVNIHNHKE